MDKMYPKYYVHRKEVIIMKKIIEIILTAAAAVAVVGALLMSCGCKSAEERMFEEMTGMSYDDALVLTGISSLDMPEGCGSLLTCLGCLNMTGGTNCCGQAKASYHGCIDCFGITACRGDSPEDYITIIEGCGGCYIANFAIQSDSADKVMPIYGCYTRND